VTVLDVFYENETAYIIMEFIEGVTLNNYLREIQRPLGVEESFALLRPVMEDLAKVHKLQIIHRDISPDNLMMRTDGTLVLLDLGAAKDLSSAGGQSSFLVAKKGFSPMEQYTQNGHIGPWTDVYAMCATIVYCVTGKLIPDPLERYSGSEIDLSEFSPDFGQALARGLIISPEKRTQSMEELYDQLMQACVPSPAPTPTPPTPPAPTPPVDLAVNLSVAFTVTSAASSWLFVTRTAVSPVVLLIPTLAAKPAPRPTAKLAVTKVLFQLFSLFAKTEIFFPLSLLFALSPLLFTSALTVEVSSIMDTPAPAATAA
jgi:serine/threonine protein kinase